MSNVVVFPGRQSRADKLAAVFDVFRHAVASRIVVTASADGRLSRTEAGDAARETAAPAPHVLSCGAHAFSVFASLREFYRQRLGATTFDRILTAIRADNAYSDHIVDKAADFVRYNRIEFNRDAQFRPSTIRRPEKNLYFATTFNMVVTRFFVECHRSLIESGERVPVFVLQNVERCDRCSLRLLQNMHLFLKPFSIEWHLVFKVAQSASAPSGEDPYLERFVAARRQCFRKFLNVALASGSMTEVIDVETFVDRVDFEGGYRLEKAAAAGDPAPTLDDFMNLVYRNRYEEFYVRKAILDASPERDEADRIEAAKLLLLVDAFNYLFDEALSVADRSIETSDDQTRCYFLLMSGLIQLKKRNDKEAALATMQRGLDLARALPPSLAAGTEKAFLGNAMNFVRLIEIMSSTAKEQRASAIEAILADEHAILQEMCEAFISAVPSEISDTDQQMNALFIITTIVENISKLNALVEAWDETIELYQSYEHILGTVGDRMRSEEYKRSFTISYSHALFHNRILMATCHAKLGDFRKAYEITRDVLGRAGEYDVTGDYRGFALNAHSVSAARCDEPEEVADCLAEMARIYVAYNEPFLIKSAINGLKDFIRANDPKSFAYLEEIGIIEVGFRRHSESTFLVSSPVDLENPLVGGLEQAVFGRRSESELRRYLDDPKRTLNAAYRSYGLWRQISNRRAVEAS
ncbi:MAG: hypothetical protein ACFE0R_13525 [Salinarimonas sp.]